MATGDLGASNLRRALDGFVAAIRLKTDDYPDFVRDVIDSGRIQKFEHCVELFWKHLRWCLVNDGFDVPNSPKATLKAGLERGFILEDEYSAALALLTDRNACSHVYREATVVPILARMAGHAEVMQAIVGRLPDRA